MIPDAGSSTAKGFFFGDSYYWAPTDWMDATVGATYLSKRGWSQTGAIRMRPWENAKLDISYYGVIDRGLPEPGGIEKQGGHEAHLGFDAFLPHGWRTVVDLNQLTSLTFRLAFAETFSQAVNSEVRNTTFATKNFSGFSIRRRRRELQKFPQLLAADVHLAALRSRSPLRFRRSSPLRAYPYLFFLRFLHRRGPSHGHRHRLRYAHFVERSEIAPSVTIPLHWGPWLGVTSNFHSAFHLVRRATHAHRPISRPIFPPHHRRIHSRCPPTLFRTHLRGRRRKVEAHHRARIRLPLREWCQRFRPLHSLR